MAASYMKLDGSFVEVEGEENFDSTWCSWGDVRVGGQNHRFAAVRAGSTENEPESDLRAVEEASAAKGGRLIAFSNAHLAESDLVSREGEERAAQYVQTVFVLQLDEYELTASAGGIAPLDVFADILSRLDLQEDNGIAIRGRGPRAGRTNAVVGTNGGLGIHGTRGGELGPTLVEILDESKRSNLPLAPGRQMAGGETWRIEDDERVALLFANDSVVAKLSSTRGPRMEAELLSTAKRLQISAR